MQSKACMSNIIASSKDGQRTLQRRVILFVCAVMCTLSTVIV